MKEVDMHFPLLPQRLYRSPPLNSRLMGVIPVGVKQRKRFPGDRNSSPAGSCKITLIHRNVQQWSFPYRTTGSKTWETIIPGFAWGELLQALLRTCHEIQTKKDYHSEVIVALLFA
jgi:hypothetical protein